MLTNLNGISVQILMSTCSIHFFFPLSPQTQLMPLSPPWSSSKVNHETFIHIFKRHLSPNSLPHPSQTLLSSPQYAPPNPFLPSTTALFQPLPIWLLRKRNPLHLFPLLPAPLSIFYPYSFTHLTHREEPFGLSPSAMPYAHPSNFASHIKIN